jgi:DNA-binding winged helix-turn-helix (wHTH) protein
MRYRFGDHRLDLRAGTLQGPQGEVHLRLKTFELLRELLRRAGQMVPRGELLRAVWGDVCLGDDALAQAISELRKALGDDSRTPRFIETLHRRGYRFVCAVAIEADGPSTDAVVFAPQAPAPPPPPRRGRWAWALLAPGFVGCAMLVVQHDAPPHPGSHPRRVAVLDLQPLGGSGGDWSCEAVPELLAEELERYGDVAIYSRERLAIAAVDVGVAGRLSADQAHSLRRYLDADFVAGGTCMRSGDTVAVDLALYDGSASEPRLAVSQRFAVADIGWQVEQWNRELGRAVSPHQPAPPSVKVRRNIPVAAMEGYFKGRRLLPHDPRGALALLDAAAMSRPRAGRIQRVRAQALVALGDLHGATAAARLARNHRPGREGEAEYLRTLGQPEAALAVLAETARGCAPEQWLDALEDLESAGRPETVLATLDTLAGAFDGSWLGAEFALVEARAARTLGQGERLAAAARRATELARARGHRSTAEQAEALAEAAPGGRQLRAALDGP